MLKTLLNTILLLASFTMFAQSTISGKVLDEKNQPLSFANVVLYETESNKAIKATTVADDGTYTFKNGDKYEGEFKDDKYSGKGYILKVMVIIILEMSPMLT